MLTKLSRCLPVYLFSAVLISWCGSTVAAEVKPQAWPLIRIPDPVARRAAIDALETASARFADADCRKILTDFEDGNGRSLADGLSSLAVDIQGYLTMVTFIDDSRHARCVSGVLAITAPGSRVVRVCAVELKLINAQQPRDTSSRRSFTRSCTRWGWARILPRRERSRHACSLDAAGSRQA